MEDPRFLHLQLDNYEWNEGIDAYETVTLICDYCGGTIALSVHKGNWDAYRINHTNPRELWPGMPERVYTMLEINPPMHPECYNEAEEKVINQFTKPPKLSYTIYVYEDGSIETKKEG